MGIGHRKLFTKAATTIGVALMLIVIGKTLRDRTRQMQTDSRTGSDKDIIEASVTVRRPVHAVYSFYRNFQNLPTFLGDVITIEPTGPATSRWTIEGPFGIQAHWIVQVTEERENEVIRYETVTSPARRVSWNIHFAQGTDPGETQVREVMKAPGGKLLRAALALIGKPPAAEVSANLHRLKQFLETGKVIDTTYSVRGKFARL
jgi:uncharacterized membrane protein